MHEKKENGWALWENSPSVRSIQPESNGVTGTNNTKRKQTEGTAVRASQGLKGGRHNDSVLMREDGGLPEASLDDGGAAELGSLIQPIQHLDGGFPVDTGISDADTIFESRGAIFGNILPASVDVGFNHDTGDGTVAGNQLLADGVDDLWLIVVVLERVSVRAVHHDAWLVLRTRLLERSSSSLDVFSSVVRSLGATSKDDVDILVAGGLDDGSKTLFGDTHESVGVGSRLHGINSNADTSISSVLEADREGDTGGELTVKLRLSGTSTDSTPRDKVSNVLGRDGVEKLGSDGNAEVGEVAQKLTSKAETLVDLEGPIEVWVINESLPSDGCAGFFKVSPHNDEEVTPFGDLGLEEFSVIDRLLRRVDRAGANDNEKSIIVSGQNSSGIVASRGDGLLRGSSRDDLVAQ